MKEVIQEEIYCDDHNRKKYLSPQYAALVSKAFYGKTVTLICFPIDRIAITSKNVKKALKKVKNPALPILYFARCFTLEAIKYITNNNGTAFAIVEYPWTDDGYCQRLR